MFKPAFVVVISGFLSLLIFLSCAPKQTLDAQAKISGFGLDHNENLQAEADALLPLFDKMPSVPIYLKDELIQKSGTNTEKGSAYTHCYGQERPTIFVKKIFYQKANRKQLVNALKHELTHAWLCRRRQMFGHDAKFYEKFKQVGGVGN